jgi:predicted enzyme related to lactoylglutathione lyase
MAACGATTSSAAVRPAEREAPHPTVGQSVFVGSANRLVAVVMEVADVDRSLTLYRDAFGLDLHVDDHAGDDHWISGRHAATSSIEGEFIHFALYASKDGSTTTRAQVAFRVDDLDAAHTRALDAGAELIHAPKDQPWGRSARYRDHDGNVIELTQRP